MKLRDAVGERRVWLKSFWGFTPETWGCVGFTKEHARNHFIATFLKQASPPGLVAVYVSTTAPRENRHMRDELWASWKFPGNWGRPKTSSTSIAIRWHART